MLALVFSPIAAQLYALVTAKIANLVAPPADTNDTGPVFNILLMDATVTIASHCSSGCRQRWPAAGQQVWPVHQRHLQRLCGAP